MIHLQRLIIMHEQWSCRQKAHYSNMHDMDPQISKGARP